MDIDVLIGMVVGAFIGGIVTVIIMALMVLAGRNDDYELEQEYQEYIKQLMRDDDETE